MGNGSSGYQQAPQNTREGEGQGQGRIGAHLQKTEFLLGATWQVGDGTVPELGEWV